MAIFSGITKQTQTHHGRIAVVVLMTLPYADPLDGWEWDTM